MKFTHQIKGMDAYLAAAIDISDNIDMTTYGMLANNSASLPELLPLTVTHLDGAIELKYRITGKKSARNFFSFSQSRAKVLSFLNGIIDILEKAEDYLISPSQIMLDVDLLYVDPVKVTPCMICLPVESAYNGRFGCEEFFCDLMRIIKCGDAAKGQDDVVIMKIRSFLFDHKTFELSELKALLESMKNDVPINKVVIQNGGVSETPVVTKDVRTEPVSAPADISIPVSVPPVNKTPEPEEESSKGGNDLFKKFLGGLRSGKKADKAEAEEAASSTPIVSDLAAALQRMTGEAPAEAPQAAPKPVVNHTPASNPAVVNHNTAPASVPVHTPAQPIHREEPMPTNPGATVIDGGDDGELPGMAYVENVQNHQRTYISESIKVSRMRGMGELVIEDGHISSNHARIYKDGARFFIEDTESANHTYVNGNVVVPGQDVELHNGDEIRFWKIAFYFGME